MFLLRTLIMRYGKKYCDDSWKVLTQAAPWSHRPLFYQKINLLIHILDPQTCAACRTMLILSPLNYSSHWTLFQMLMPKRSSSSCWTRWLSHCGKTTVCRSDIFLYQCHQHDSRQQKNDSIRSWPLQLAYYLGSPPLSPIKPHPATLLEHVLIYGRMCQAETQRPLCMRLQISKYMECLLEVPNSGHCEVAQYNWRLQQDVQASYLYCPYNLANYYLVSLHAIRCQLRRILNPRCLITREKRDAFWQKSHLTSDEVLFNMFDWHFHIFLWRHGQTIISTI